MLQKKTISYPLHLSVSDGFHLILIDYTFDVQGFCVMKLTSDIQYLCDIQEYTQYSNDLSRRNGGVPISVNNKVSTF